MWGKQIEISDGNNFYEKNHRMEEGCSACVFLGGASYEILNLPGSNNAEVWSSGMLGILTVTNPYGELIYLRTNE